MPRIQRSQHLPTPFCNPVYLLDVLNPLQHQRRRLLQILSVHPLIAYLLQTFILRRHPQYEQNPHKVLRPCEQMRHQSLLILGRRKDHWP